MSFAEDGEGEKDRLLVLGIAGSSRVPLGTDEVPETNEVLCRRAAELGADAPGADMPRARDSSNKPAHRHETREREKNRRDAV